MRWPIRAQLLLPMLLVVLLTIALASGAVAYWRFVQVRQRELDDLRRVTATLADASFPLSHRVLQQISGLSGAEFVVLDADGQLQHATVQPSGDELHTARRAAQQTAQPSGTAMLGSKVQVGQRSFLVHEVPLVRPLADGRRGTLLVFYPEDRWSAAVRQAVVPSLLAALVMATVVAVMTALLARRLVEPIKRLGAQAAAIAAGDFRPLPVPARNDEIRDLAVSINSMAEKLSRYGQQVRDNERTRLLGQLGVGMAHQLRNAVTGAAMAIELHKQDCPAPDSEALQVAIRQLRLIESYLQRFMGFGRAQPLLHQSIALPALVEEVFWLLRPAAAHAAVELVFAPTAEKLSVRGDAESLRHLLMNLVLNGVAAAKSAQDGAQVVVELHRVSRWRAMLLVKDNGPGPSPEIAEKLFEPFVTNKAGGVGLGLSVARHIAEAHGGSISFQRTGNWTCLAVELPLEDS